MSDREHAGDCSDHRLLMLVLCYGVVPAMCWVCGGYLLLECYPCFVFRLDQADQNAQRNKLYYISDILMLMKPGERLQDHFCKI